MKNLIALILLLAVTPAWAGKFKAGESYIV